MSPLTSIDRSEAAWDIPPFEGMRFPTEPAYLVEGARVLWADHEALGADLAGWTGPLSDSGRSVIERWLIANTAVISDRQRAANAVNDAVACHPTPIRALRPPHYGRSLVVPVPSLGGTARESGGCVDVKGCGVARACEPQRLVSGTGLLAMSQAFRELITQRIVERAFARMGIAILGLPIYAILDLGLEGRSHDGSRLSATVIVRKAHRRPRDGSSFPKFCSAEHRVILLTEIALRMAGLTSVSDMTRSTFRRAADGKTRYRYARRDEQPAPRDVTLDDIAGQGWENTTFDILNIQLTDDFSEYPLRAELVDFGHYQASQDDAVSLVSSVADRFFRWGAYGGTAWGDDLGAMRDLCVDRGILLNRPAPPEICRWEMVDPVTAWSGFYRFGLETSHAIAHQDLIPAQVAVRITEFVDRVAPML